MDRLLIHAVLSYSRTFVRCLPLLARWVGSAILHLDRGGRDEEWGHGGERADIDAVGQVTRSVRT